MADLKKRTVTVLCVDDDQNHLEGLGMIVSLEGHKVLKAYCYEEAVKILNSGEEIDILLTDYKMGEMSGIDLCDYTQTHFPHIKKVIVTSMQSVLDMYEEFQKIDALVMKASTAQEQINEIIHDKLARDKIREKDVNSGS